ncbi:Kinesin light chain, partial [Madurella mycetomatis]
MNRLALVFLLQEEYDEAEQLQRQTMELRQKILGVEHPDTLTSMNRLALVFLLQEEYDEAEQLQRQTMELRQRILGVEHPDTLA